MVSLVLVGLACVWCWFWSVRGCGGPIGLRLFGSASVLVVAVVSLTLPLGLRSVFVLVIGCKRGEESRPAIAKKESNEETKKEFN